MEERKAIFQYGVTVSVSEVYNEHVRVLLDEATVSNKKEAWNYVEKGSEARIVRSTNANEHSSRSHCIQCVTVKAKELISGDGTKSKLCIVDLAGSERVVKTGAEGERLKEAKHINKSLSALGDVIAALASKASHIPFRNSKLTTLLQDSLSGGSKTLMLAQISPNKDDMGGTMSTLNFASRVRGVELGEAKKQDQRSTSCKPTNKPAPVPLKKIPEHLPLSSPLIVSNNRIKRVNSRPPMTPQAKRKAGGAAAVQEIESAPRAVTRVALSYGAARQLQHKRDKDWVCNGPHAC